MKFRKISCSFVPPTPIYEDKPIEKIVDGVKTIQENLVDICDPALSDTMPSPDEYTLENLLSAGVGLDQVPTNVLTPTDAVIINNEIANSLEVIEKSNNENK